MVAITVISHVIDLFLWARMPIILFVADDVSTSIKRMIKNAYLFTWKNTATPCWIYHQAYLYSAEAPFSG